MKSRTVLVVVVGIVLLGCRVNLPEPIHQTLDYIGDSNLETQAELCKRHLNALREKARQSQRYADVMVVLGGSIGAASGTTSAIVGASVKDDVKSKDAWTVSSASIAAAGALVAVFSELVDDSSIPLQKYFLSEAHWKIGLKIANELPTLDAASGRLYRYAIARFTECRASSPEPVPPLPEDTEVMQTSTDDGCIGWTEEELEYVGYDCRRPDDGTGETPNRDAGPWPQ